MAKLNPLNFILKNNNTVIMRNLIASDAKEFLEFRKEISKESTHTMHYEGMSLPSVEDQAERLKVQEEDKIILNIGVFDQNKLIGYLNFRPVHAGHPWVNHAAQFGLMTLKKYWGLGIGKKLLELQDQHAISIEVNRIEATVRSENDRGVKLYLHQGYQIEGTRKQATLINGIFHDEFYIAKILNDSLLNWKPLILTTDRLILRPIEIQDAQNIFEYAKNPNVSKYTLWMPHQSVADSISYIKDYVFDYYKKGIPEPLGIAFKNNPEKIIGTVGCFWCSKTSKSMELAYAIREEDWGKGIVPEAAKALMDYCFKEFKLKRIQAHCKVENTASARVMEKIGMNFEGTFKSAKFHRDQFWDMKVYAKIVE